MKKIAINGFGRIGRMLTRILVNEPSIDIVAINDIADINTMMHLFKYDSVHGQFKGDVYCDEDTLVINEHTIKFINEKEIENLPWNSLDVDIAIDSTGLLKTKSEVELHLFSGAKKVILSAPPKDNSIDMVCLGINDSIIKDQIILSNASCTTNSAAPLIKILDENVGLESAYITTVHSYTTDQRLQDSPHKDLRRARAAALSIVPTTTGAAKAITRIFPHLSNSMGGCGIRVPVPDGSLTDISCVVKKNTTVDELNALFQKNAENELKGILQYSNEPLVSSDIIGNVNSCIFDSELTSVIGKMVKVVGWYDNEIGYSNRLKELIIKF